MDTSDYKNGPTSVELNNCRPPHSPLNDDYLFLRIYIPDLDLQKCFQFSRIKKSGEIKEQCIASLPSELKQSFNYGLFLPPSGIKCGKFLDEEKTLKDYQFSDSIGYLELRFKQRIYKTSKIDEKQFKQINSKTNLRRFIYYIHNDQVDKIAKLCSKGIDPNFHCVDTGETPLTLASTLSKPGKVLMALVNGGAFLDFRNLNGSTALHRAVENNNIEAAITLLELGASPNYRDVRGLTPLYISITRKTDVLICERLLHDRATIGAKDEQGWQEVHHACRHGHIQQLEHLLVHGADINAKNASGNTPLHVCAVNGQEICAKMLLQKGALNDALNFANQTPYQVAIIAGNLELATIIQNFKINDADKIANDSSDVISNNSSGIGTANSSDFTESNFAVKVNESVNFSASGQLNENFSSMSLSNQNFFPNHNNDATIYRPSKNMTDRAVNSNKYYATAPRQKTQLPVESRTVVLHKTKRGFGFVLRGAKATSSLMDIKISDVCPALQYLDDVDKGSAADLAGLRKGDYLLAINGEDVSVASHEQVVDLIRNSGKLVQLTVVSRNSCNKSSMYDAKYSEWQASAPLSYATLPNKFKKNRNSSAGHIIAPLPPRRDPKTTLSVGKAKSRNLMSNINDNKPSFKTNADAQPKTASIRSRPISSRITTAELQELFQRQAELSPVYQEQFGFVNKSKSFKNEKSELHRSFYSVPDLVQITICNNKPNQTANFLRNHKSQDNVNGHDSLSAEESSSTSSQLSSSNTNVKTKDKNHVYAQHLHNNIASSKTAAVNVNSSFNPNNNAIIYAHQSDIIRPKEIQNSSSCNNRNQVRKSASLHSYSSLKHNRYLVGNTNTLQHTRHRNNYVSRNSHPNNANLSPPVIPDPDYSQSDEENEQQNKSVYKISTLPLPNNRKNGNKLTVCANGDDSAARNINVDELRKARLLLKSSVFPNANYIVIPNNTEDGDNSSSGVSSDQEIPLTGKNVPGIARNRNSLSFVQLPPLTNDSVSGSERKENDFVVLPPPQYVGNVSLSAVEVLEPPPQFSDSRPIIN